MVARRQEDVAPEEAEAFDVELGADRVVRDDVEVEVAELRFNSLTVLLLNW